MFKLLAVVTMATMFFQFATMLPVASAQEENPSYVWHTFFGSSSYADGVTGIAADNSGNVYVSGSSNGSWNGPGGVPPLRPYPYSPGYSASVLVKYNSDGVYQWHSFMPGGNVKVDTNGNVYLIGSVDATLCPMVKRQSIPSMIQPPMLWNYIFLMKLNSDGVYQ
jgi:hypothetical protein